MTDWADQDTLTNAQEVELLKLTADFIDDRRADNMRALVILYGRGVCKCAYAEDSGPYVPTMLATAYAQVRAKNASTEN